MIDVVVEDGVDKNKDNIAKKTELILKILRQTPRIHIDEIEKKTGLAKQRIFAVLTELVKETALDIRVTKQGMIILGIKPLEPLEALDVNFLAEKRGLWRPYITVAAVTGLNLGHRNQISEFFMKTLYDVIVPELKVDFAVVDGGFVLGNLSRARLGETCLDEFDEYFSNGCPVVGNGGTGRQNLNVNNNKESSAMAAALKGKIGWHLFNAQVEYISHYFPSPSPDRKIHTYVVGGLEEMSFRSMGFNILEAVCGHRLSLGRDDLVYRGDEKAFFRIINTGSPVPLWILHTKRRPFRGAYTRGHRPRRMALAIADWFQDMLQKQKEIIGYPRVVIWTDGSGVETHQKIADIDFVTLPRLNPLDQGEIDINTGTPNIGVEIIRLWFNDKGVYDHAEVMFFKLSHLIPLIQGEIEKNSIRANGSFHFTGLEKKILNVLKRDGASMSDLVRDRDIKSGKKRIENAIANASKKGVVINYNSLSNRYELEKKPLISFKSLPKKYFFKSKEIISETSLWLSDLHFGSLQAQPHLMIAIAELGEKFKVNFFGIPGDVLNGLKHLDQSRGQNILIRGEWQRKLAVLVLPVLNKDVYIRPGGHDNWASTTEGVRLLKDAVEMLNVQCVAAGGSARFHYIGADELYQFTSEKGTIYEMLHLEKPASVARTYAVQRQREDRTPEYLTEERRGVAQRKAEDLLVKQKIRKARISRRQPMLSAAGNWHRDFSYVDGDTLELVMASLSEETDWEIDKGQVHDLGVRIATVARNADDKLVFASRQYIDLRNLARRVPLQDFENALIYLALTLSAQPENKKWNNFIDGLINKGAIKSV